MSDALWKFVNRERGSPNNILTSSIHLHDGNQVVSSPSITCNFFNKTLVEVVNNLIFDKNLMHSQISNSITGLKDSFVMLEITEVELSKTVHSMMKKTSTGLDDISTYLLKKCAPHIIKPLLELVNASI
jgi:hypothetical protein